MEFRGEFDIKAPVQRVWASFWDETLMPAWLPGCKAAQWEGDRRVQGEVEQSVAQLKATFAFDLEVVEKQEPVRLHLAGTGKGKTISSDVRVDMIVELAPLEGAATHITYIMNAEIGGVLANVGNFVLKLKGKELQRRMAQDVRSRLEREGAA
jgi:carbon monoxide dehydrogenase subunit G